MSDSVCSYYDAVEDCNCRVGCSYPSPLILENKINESI